MRTEVFSVTIALLHIVGANSDLRKQYLEGKLGSAMSPVPQWRPSIVQKADISITARVTCHLSSWTMHVAFNLRAHRAHAGPFRSSARAIALEDLPAGRKEIAVAVIG
jgi:hypothetical protein